MLMVKVCPSCGAENAVNETLCDQCMCDISGITPTEADEVTPEPAAESEDKRSDGTTVEASIYFECGRGGFTARDGDVLGRDHVGREHLSRSDTVSRRHARVFISNGRWYIEDLHSTNGLWLNENRIDRAPLKDGDNVLLSRSCALIVRM